MQENESIDGGDAELLNALRGLELAPSKSNAREIWFAAGRREGQRQMKRWRLASIGMSLVAGGILIHTAFPAGQVSPTSPPSLVRRPISQPTPLSAPAASQDRSLANLRASAMQLATLHAVAEKGLSGLPMSSSDAEVIDFPKHFGDREWFDPATDKNVEAPSRGGR
jgi:hypothetical protein